MDESTKQQMKCLLREIVQEQQVGVLQAAAHNAEKMVEERLQKSQSELKDVIDDEVAGCSHAESTFKNNINRSNYEFCRQVQDIWRKTERAIDERQTPKAKTLLEKGKKIINNRMKALKIADKEGWDVALAYLSDELASDDEQEKRLKKARRDTDSKRATSGKRVMRNPDYGKRDTKKFTGNFGEGQPFYQKPFLGRKSWPSDDKVVCWSCGRLGHKSTQSPQKGSQKW